MSVPLSTETIYDDQVQKTLDIDEGQFLELKAIEIEPSRLTKTISAFANSDGGDLYVGVKEITKVPKARTWEGFRNEEATNGHLQIFEQLFPLGTDFHYEFLKCNSKPGLVLHVQVNKTKAIMLASNGIPYIRRSASNLPVQTPEAMKRLEYSKGITSFESEPTNVSKEIITESNVVNEFIKQVIPTVQPEAWLRKQTLIREERPTVAGLLLFSDEPQAVLPKRSGVKVYRYKTSESEGFRDVLAFTPKTVEGCLYQQIKQAVSLTREIAESIPKVGAQSLEAITYPETTLHEIITNAVIHRDYSVADDVHIRIFDNRIEIESPGRLPAHVTIHNYLDERFARNGAIVRILNKFPDPPNKDVGEGLNTAFRAMTELGLKEPILSERDNSVLVLIKHEPLASPEEAIMDYLDQMPIGTTINNSQARALTYIRADYQMKAVFNRMVKMGMIQQVPGTRTSNTAYRKPLKLSLTKQTDLKPEGGTTE